MTTDRSGVIATRAEIVGQSLASLLVLDELEAFLDANALGRGPISWARIGEGQSNVTFRITRADLDLVPRRGPRPPLPPSAHDMVRESRLIRVLFAIWE